MRTVTFCNVLHVLISWISRVSWPSENKQQQQKLAGKCTFLSIKNSLSRDRKSILTLEQFEHLSKACYCSWPLFRVCSIFNSLRYSDRSYFACVTGRDVLVELFLGVVSLVRSKFQWANDSSMVPSDRCACSVTCSALRGLQKQRMKKHWATSRTTTALRKVCKFYKPKETSSYTVFNRVLWVIAKSLGSNSDENFIPRSSVKFYQEGNGLYTNSNSIIGR